MAGMSFDAQKTEQALLYIAAKQAGRRVSKLTALKLIFLADRYHLRKYARTITGDEYFAMKFGPVASNTKTLIEGIINDSGTEMFEVVEVNGHEEMKARVDAEDFDFDELSETDKEALDAAIRRKKSLRGNKLIEYTHLFPEWKRWESALEIKKREKMDIEDFFRPAPEEVEYCDVSQEHAEISKEVFLDC